MRTLVFISMIALYAPFAIAGDSLLPEEKPALSTVFTPWQTEAQTQRGITFRKTRGTLVIDGQGVTFVPREGPTKKWAFLDIHTFALTPHRLTLQSFSARSLHRPGEQRFEFDLAQAVPPAVAASFANALRRPSRNGVPDADAVPIASIGVRHHRLAGGTNGVLRFRNEGIDYVTDTPGDSRSWRWADLQTLSDPDPYHLLVFGYRDTYTFDLKEPLSRTVLQQAVDAISTRSAMRSE